ncbi:D-TA family PLP-dependent enzyme [Pseudozobellia thermophila]|uniref:D-serine deaminase, pyridoxal phosphate-dependent n=1 Tax=Pseudozobellia thermophila TaxID=192903 RepID=A0A1M6ADV0_9FLAO|nr:D-TA family PLP-dependent enzyme [Pseudozobellia thermophila]SHI34498.1 D-serine deaminase, pyridoxal phosphate-dependent [Pseudozobellia thermophila]
MATNTSWYALKNTEGVVSPALLVYPERIRQNIQTMLGMSQGPDFLRPHVKTHKTAEIVNLQLEQGIYKFKCATIAEAELLARCGAPDVLLAMQPVGANIERFLKLVENYPKTQFSALVDHPIIVERMGRRAREKNRPVSLWMDINTGMDRTGILPDETGIELYRKMHAHSHIEAMGLHTYDGHIGNTDVARREEECQKAFDLVLALRDTLAAEGIEVPNVVAGGSPTFPFHARREGVEASPGTTLLWDAGYARLYPEMDFLPAAVLFTRIISKPAKGILCTDLGHKSIAPEMPFPRVRFLDKADWQQKGQSEEHFVIECENSDKYPIGDTAYALPVHICPTVAKYARLQVVSEGEIVDTWEVAARDQTLTL